MVEVVPFEADNQQHVEGVAAVCRSLGWPSYADPDVARRGCTAPGVVTRLAVDGATVVGFAQACGDGVIQSFLSQLGVLESYRRRGLASRLVEATFAATGTQRMDLLTDDAEAFYRSFEHKEKPGYRIYPG